MIADALYLPQFHVFKENDVWWGDGFTEWTNVKSARTICQYHKHPWIPSWGYYDLSNIDTMRLQAEHAKKIGIDNFAVYHYWSDSHLLMEKPTELLLKDESINFPFYFVWANHSFFNKVSFQDKKLLWKQKYSASLINSHVDYLAKFFTDKRYHKINGSPVFSIYDARRIPEFGSFWAQYCDAFWNKYKIDVHLRLAIKDYHDVKFIGKIRNLVDSVYEYNPYYINHSTWLRSITYESMLRFKRDFLNKLTTVDALKVQRRIKLAHRSIKDIPYGYGVYTGWDTTPRWKERGIVHSNITAQDFKSQINEATLKMNDDDFIMVTAWNEWGEGAILEPRKHGEQLFVK